MGCRVCAGVVGAGADVVGDAMSRELLVAIRQALLMIVDALERELSMPRTAELRKEKRQPERSSTDGGM